MTQSPPKTAEEIAQDILFSYLEKNRNDFLCADITDAIKEAEARGRVEMNFALNYCVAWPDENEVAQYMDKEIGGYDYHARILYRWLKSRMGQK